MLQNLWSRPPGLRGTASSRSSPVESRPCTRRWPTRASAADEGVRPIIYADVRLWENYVALTVRERSAPLSLPAVRVLGVVVADAGGVDVAGVDHHAVAEAQGLAGADGEAAVAGLIGFEIVDAE